MDEAENDRALKQNYLVDEILNGGYDANEFKEYMDDLKPDG